MRSVPGLGYGMPDSSLHSIAVTQSGNPFSPGNQLATYEFVAIWAALLPVFDIIPVEMKERRMMDGFTSTMEGQFHVKVRRRADGHL